MKEVNMQSKHDIPKFVSIVAIGLGCLDLMRGFMHTILLDFAATNIAGFDLSTSLAGDLLQMMDAFGISNYLTGAMLILLGWKARPLALIMLGFIPAAYAIGIAGIKVNSAAYAPSQAAWGGTTFMLVYMAICIVTFVAGVSTTLYRKKKEEVIIHAES
jgi:hypothetical protein